MEAIKVHLEVRDWQYSAGVRRDNGGACRQRRIWRSAITATSAVTLMVAGFFGYSEMTMAHQFTKGKVDIQLSNDGITYSDGVTRTWVSPTNWAPGDELTAQLYISDTGKKAVESLLADWTNPAYGDPNLLDVVEVTSWRETADGLSVNRAPLYAVLYDDDGDGRLSLWELVNAGTISLGLPAGYISSPGPDPVMSGGIFPADGVYVVEMSFRFMEEAGNEYQGAAASFVLQITAGCCDGTGDSDSSCDDDSMGG
ncbi:MAG: hypothetical protein ACYC4M_08405 [Thermoleophilia bacterium]